MTRLEIIELIGSGPFRLNELEEVVEDTHGNIVFCLYDDLVHSESEGKLLEFLNRVWEEAK